MMRQPVKLPSNKHRGRKMAEIQCDWCQRHTDYLYTGGKGFFIGKPSTFGAGPSDYRHDTLRGLLTCAECKRQTLFEMNGNVVTFKPGRLFEEDIGSSVTSSVRELLHQAQLCLYGMAYRAIPGMVRGAIEGALADKGIRESDLFNSVEKAKTSGILTDDMETLATGARLLGKRALHKNMDVSQSQAIALITATIDLVNHIALQKPVPASQSGKGSNAP